MFTRIKDTYVCFSFLWALKAELYQAFRELDSDGSGEIEYSEFVIATMNEKNLLSNNKL